MAPQNTHTRALQEPHTHTHAHMHAFTNASFLSHAHPCTCTRSRACALTNLRLSQGISYANVAFNETCEFVDTTTAFDLEFFALIGIFGALSLGLLLIFTDFFKPLLGGGASAKPKKPSKKVSGAPH